MAAGNNEGEGARLLRRDQVIYFQVITSRRGARVDTLLVLW